MKLWRSSYPASLVGNPLRYPLGHNKLDDPADDVGEEAINSTAQVRYCKPVAEAEQSDDSTPVDATFTKQPTNTCGPLFVSMYICVSRTGNRQVKAMGVHADAVKDGFITWKHYFQYNYSFPTSYV